MAEQGPAILQLCVFIAVLSRGMWKKCGGNLKISKLQKYVNQ